jgi:hypothetical protein
LNGEQVHSKSPGKVVKTVSLDEEFGMNAFAFVKQYTAQNEESFLERVLKEKYFNNFRKLVEAIINDNAFENPDS